MMCNDATLNEENKAQGEPTEAALVNYAFKLNLNKNELDIKYPRLCEAPFDSMRKMMSTVHDVEGKIIQYTKGAPDELLRVCTRILTKDGVWMCAQPANAIFFIV